MEIIFLFGSVYIRCYMGIHNGRVFQTMEAIQELTSLGHIAYLGLKPVDMRNMMTCSESVGWGYALLILPDDLNSISSSQKAVCLLISLFFLIGKN